MEVVCNATVATNTTEVKTAALQCLVRIMSLYYRLMEVYMQSALFQVPGYASARARATSRARRWETVVLTTGAPASLWPGGGR